MRIILLLLFFQITHLAAQEIQLIIPQQYEDKVDGKNIAAKEVFYLYPFRSETVDLKDFKEKQANAKLPDSIKITLPNLAGIQDTTLLMGFIKDHSNDPGLFVLLVAGNYETEEIHFFVDVNADQNYLNDGAPTIVQAGAIPTYIALHPMDGRSRELGLSVPKRPDLVALTIQELKNDYRTKIRNQFSLGLALGAGPGKLSYQYDNLNFGFPTWYDVSLVEKDIRLSFNYNFPRFKIGLNTNYNSIYYYTSYLNVRVDEPMGLRTGVSTEPNIDQHSKRKVELGVSAAYRIFLGQLAEMQPFVTYGKSKYFPGTYYADSRPNKEVSYDLSATSFLEYGVQMDFTIGRENAFFLTLLRSQLWWKPDNFLEDLNFSNLETKYFVWKFALGYRIGL